RLLHDGGIEEDVLAIGHREGLVGQIEHVAVLHCRHRVAVHRCSAGTGPAINLHHLDHDPPHVKSGGTLAAAHPAADANATNRVWIPLLAGNSLSYAAM